jgi:dihydroceramidase
MTRAPSTGPTASVPLEQRTTSTPQSPPVLLTGPVLGIVIFLMLCCTTTLYLAHDRTVKAWENVGMADNKTLVGYWSPPSGDFNWCEVDYVFTPYVSELWNSATSLFLLVGPALAWKRATSWEVRLNLFLLAIIGVGSTLFHATLQYEHQLLDEVPMLCYIVHTVAILARQDMSCPLWVKMGSLALCVLLFTTPRDATVHEIGRMVLVLCFSSCFVWLASSLAPICAQLDAGFANNGPSSFAYTRLGQWASFVLLLAVFAWLSDNLACGALHNLPFGLPYLQLHAVGWHIGIAFVCHCLCQIVMGKHEQARLKHRHAE